VFAGMFEGSLGSKYNDGESRMFQDENDYSLVHRIGRITELG
jgi:hypothetical protein